MPIDITPNGNDAFVHELTTDAWLDDSLIDTYINLIVKFCSKRLNKKCMAFSVHLLDLCAKNGPSEYTKAHLKEFCESEMVFLPVNTGIHWVLYIWNRIDVILEFYDSQHNGQYHRVDEILTFIEQLEQIYKQRPLKIKKKKVSFQKDSYNCGVYLLLFIRYRVENKPLTNIKHLDLRIMRYKILVELCLNAIIYDIE